MKNVCIVGSGFASLSSACYLAKAGYNVQIVEKNDQVGGRARSFTQDGFKFDMGPSWYWMPDVFESFFNDFGKSVSDYYDLVRLDPGYRVIYEDQTSIDIPAGMPEVLNLFESIESGSKDFLQKFMDQAKYKYEVGMGEFVHKPSHSIAEFADVRIIKSLFRLQMFKPISKVIRAGIKNKKLRQILEFPVLFLGAKPSNTPALYSLMNYADLDLGTWYPKGGMAMIIEGMYKLAKDLGVKFQLNSEVIEAEVSNSRIVKLKTKDESFSADLFVNGADYHHFDQVILPEKYRSYSASYWDSRTMAPSSLLFYLGVDKKIPKLLHHNLFFDADFEVHASEIYDNPNWPEKPLFYVCCPSKTDPSCAPDGMENLFLLVPLAPGLEDNEVERRRLYEIIIKRIERFASIKIKENVRLKKSYALNDFISDYNAFKGNAYGLANTLRQTAFLKPKIKSKKLTNLYNTGQLTAPGPGVPPSIISGKVVAKEIQKLIEHG